MSDRQFHLDAAAAWKINTAKYSQAMSRAHLAAAARIEVVVPPVSPRTARPFAASSPWNTPTPADTQWFDHSALHTRQVDGDNFQHWYVIGGITPVYAETTDPLWTFNMPEFRWPEGHRNRGAQTFTLNAPDSIAAGAGTDKVLCLIQPDGSYIEMWKGEVNTAARTVTASGWATGNIITGSGCGDNDNAGVRAANFSWAAGQISPEDIKAGVIDHALVVALPTQMLNDRWGAYRAPATCWDNGQGSLGPFDNGTKIGVPAGVPAGLSAIGLMVFKSLQTYGAFVGDFVGGDWPAFYADAAIPDSTLQPLYAWWAQGGRSDLDKIGPLMRIADYQP